MGQLLQIPIQAILNGHKPLVFSFVLIFEVDGDLVFLLLESFNEVSEA
jgi:hypothetical protein